ncbi:E3 ubiquitin-protein ligase [Forsythia ovata]|uniref:RING-type E3 ubiquitin transferase n=1 Tax=Forsythia ovata TaxID=205694 RepID=A0ABD1SAE7_9LAMI
MLSAIISLSFVVLLVTILHIYARFVLRRQARRQAALRRLGFISSAAHVQSIEPPKTGLDPSVMALLPIFVFKKTNGNSSDEMGLSSMECSVCLSMLEDGERARTLPNWRAVAGATGAPPSAPPLDGANSMEGTSDGGILSTAKIIESSSRLSSFRRIISRERSFRRIQSYGQEDGLTDLERQ